MKYYKKLVITFIVTVLLLVVMSFLSVSFAFSLNECKGIVYNIYRYKWELTESEARARVESIDWTTVPDWLDGHNDFKILVYYNTIPRIDVFWWNDTVKPYYYSGTVYRVKTRLRLILQKNLPSIYYWDSANQVDTGGGYFNTDWFYTQAPLYNSSSASSPSYNAGFSNISWIESDNSYFNPVRFEPAATNTKVDLMTFEDVSVYPYALGGVFLGDFIDPNNECLFVEDDLKIYYWYSGDMLPWSLMHRDFYDSNGNATGKIYNYNRFLDVTPNAAFTDYRISLKSAFTYYNMFYVYRIGYVTEWSEGATVNYIYIPFYLSDTYTVIENGTINGPASIRDWNAYFRQFDSNGLIINDNQNTDEIIATIESGDKDLVSNINDDSQVDSILNSFSSGDSADDIINNLGLNSLSSIQNPFTSIIYNVFMGIIDCFDYDENSYFNFGYGGTTVKVYASDFRTPENNPIIVIVKWSLIFGYVYGIVWWYYRSIESLKHLGDRGMNKLIGSVRDDAYFEWRLL